MLEIVEEAQVTEAVHQARQRWARAYEQWEAVTWAIARDPEFGSPLTESGRTRLAVIQGARSIDLPTVELVYEISDPWLVAHHITFSDATAAQAGRA